MVEITLLTSFRYQSSSLLATWLSAMAEENFTIFTPTRQSLLKNSTWTQMRYSCASGSDRLKKGCHPRKRQSGSLKLAKKSNHSTLRPLSSQSQIRTPNVNVKIRKKDLNGAFATFPTPRKPTSLRWTTKNSRLYSKQLIKSTTRESIYRTWEGWVLPLLKSGLRGNTQIVLWSFRTTNQMRSRRES